MNRRPLVISLVTILVVALGALIATVSTGTTPQLGLDLQGGASVTLRPVGQATPEALAELPNIYRSRVDGLGVAEPEILVQGETIVVNLPGVKNQEEAIKLIGTTGKVLFRPVLSAFPAAAFTATTGDGAPSVATGDPTTVSVVQVTAPPIAVGQPEVITDGSTPPGTDAPAGTDAALGTDAPATSAAGAPRLPHAASPSTSAVAQAGSSTTKAPTTTAAAPASSDGDTATTDTATTDTPAGADAAPETTVAVPTTTVDPNAPTTAPAPFDINALLTPPEQDDPNTQVTLLDREGEVIYNLGPAFAFGENAIKSASPSFNALNNTWSVALELHDGPGGLGAWNDMSLKCFAAAYQGGDSSICSGGMAFVLDHRVVSAPTPSESSGGFFTSPTIEITGNFTEAGAGELTQVLKYGSSPVEMKVETTQDVSATLGKDSLRAAIIAGVIGIALVLVFLLAYYRSLALVVVAGLGVSACLLWSVISLLSKTQGLALTLSGVTGIIVSVGVTVDSYVVFFERLKDEAQSGRTFRSSALRSFKGAWRTILAADIVSLIGAATLWYLTVGAVKGFAFFLGLATLCDLLVSYFFTRPTMLLLSRSERYRTGPVLGVDAAPAGGAL